jgi:hypothetical protein
MAIQFNAYMPDEGPDAYALPTNLPPKIESAFLPVNTPVEDGQEMTVLGCEDAVLHQVWI